MRSLGPPEVLAASLACRRWAAAARAGGAMRASWTPAFGMECHRHRADAHPVAVRPHLTQRVDLKPRMRAVLVDWLVDVAVDFWLYDDTLHLAVRLVDAFMCTPAGAEVGRTMYQVVGATCLLIATKVLDVSRPHMLDPERFADVTHGACSADDIRRTELDVLNALGFRVRLPTAADFAPAVLREYDDAFSGGQPDFPVQSLTRQLVDTVLLSHDALAHKPSALAAASLAVAAHYLGRPAPTSDILLGYTRKELAPACAAVCDAVWLSRDRLPAWNEPVGHRGIFYKYWSPSKPLRQALHRQHANRHLADELDRRLPSPPPLEGGPSPEELAVGCAAYNAAMGVHFSTCRCWGGPSTAQASATAAAAASAQPAGM